MKKGFKIILLVLVFLLGISVLDTLQARVRKTSPIIHFRTYFDKASYLDKGILMDTYYCMKEDIVTVSWHSKTSKFTCLKDNETGEEHSFFGVVVESDTTYMIVEPNEEEEERKSSDKFRIELGEYNDAIYEVGTNVKITYTGLILESYPVQIDTLKIELKSVDNFELIFHSEVENTKRQIVDKNTNKKYNYNVFIWNGNVDIVLDGTTYSLEDALNKNKITMEEILAKANQEIENPSIANDGGSIEYHFEDYTIIKLHTIKGNRDVYIGNQDLKLDDVK